MYHLAKAPVELIKIPKLENIMIVIVTCSTKLEIYHDDLSVRPLPRMLGYVNELMVFSRTFREVNAFPNIIVESEEMYQ